MQGLLSHTLQTSPRPAVKLQQHRLCVSGMRTYSLGDGQNAVQLVSESYRKPDQSITLFQFDLQTT